MITQRVSFIPYNFLVKAVKQWISDTVIHAAFLSHKPFFSTLQKQLPMTYKEKQRGLACAIKSILFVTSNKSTKLSQEEA